MQLLQLTQGLFAKVDDEDFSTVTAMGRWGIIIGWKGSTFYAKHDTKHSGIRETILLHRFLLGVKKGDPRRVDHKDGDGLNCQRSNIRILTVSGNGHNRHSLQSTNTSGVHGVHWCSQKRKWKAEIRIEGKTYHLGFFTNLEEAKAVREGKVEELWKTHSF